MIFHKTNHILQLNLKEKTWKQIGIFSLKYKWQDIK